MPMRFLLEMEGPADLKPGTEISLSAERSHYLCKVMRARRDQQIECFDGHGRLMQGTVLQASAKRAVMRLDAIDEPVQARCVGVHLGISLLKGQAMDRALQQATELGAAEITLLNASRSNVKLSPERAENKLAHWRKIIMGACEQCGRLYLPGLNGPLALTEFLEQESAGDAEIMVLDQTGDRLPSSLPKQPRVALIGPEGGWDETERTLFDSRGLDRYRLGASVMRAETVPAVALALLEHVQNQEADSSAKRSSI